MNHGIRHGDRPIALPRTPDRAGRLWALGLAAATVGVTLLVWQALARSERDQIRRTAQAVAEGLGHEVEAHLESRLDAARELAFFWALTGRRSFEQWREDTEVYARGHGFQTVAWLGPHRERWLARAGPAGAPEPRPADPASARRVESAEARALREAAGAAAGPFALEGGGQAIWFYHPVARGERSEGVLAATLDLDRILDEVLRSRAPGYALVVRTPEGEIYTRGEVGEAASSAAVARFSVELPGELGFDGAVRPTPALASLETTPLPDVVLAVGLLFAALVGAVVWIGQLARSRARALDDANRELSRKVVATRSAEAGLRKLNQELEARVAARTAELNELVGDLEAFNYSVSHDLRSPLGAIINFSAVLEEDYRDRLDETGRDVLKRIGSSADLALSLMDGLLAFSRAGRERLKRERVDVEALAQEVLAELRPEELGVEVSLGPLPPAWADRTMLRVVLGNLLSNAVKFSGGRPGARVEIGSAPEDGRVVYHVRDNGVGFDMRFADKLFAVFERLHSSPGFQGSGVGLAIVNRIVRRHGGRVWAEGEPDRGATFRFSLPPGPAAEAAA